MERTDKQLIGAGLYDPGEVARLLGVQRRTLNRWLYGRKATARRSAMPPLLHPSVQDAEGIALTFRDLIELLFIAGFRKEKLSLQYIRRAAEKAAEKYGTKHPFSMKRFSTDGKKIFASDLDENLEEVVSGQFAFQRVIARYLRQLDYDFETGETIRWWPMGRHVGVTLDPQRSFGAPSLSDFGVPTQSVARAYYAEGGGASAIARVADWFEITPESVRDAVAFEEYNEGRLAAA